MNKINHIGIFDSGVGGLAVANAFLQSGFALHITYLGDNAFFPFGEKNIEEIIDRLDKGIRLLRSKGCGISIIACNTASIAIEETEYKDDPTIWPITRPVLSTIETLGIDQLSILATSFTVRSQYYTKALESHPTLSKVNTYARPDLVQVVEKAYDMDEVGPLDHLWQEAYGPNILLGCSHFHFLKEAFESTAFDGCEIWDSADIAINYFLNAYAKLNVVQNGTKPSIQFIFTDASNPPPIISGIHKSSGLPS